MWLMFYIRQTPGRYRTDLSTSRPVTDIYSKGMLTGKVVVGQVLSGILNTSAVTYTFQKLKRRT